jgi:hypothetical protein
VHLFLREPLTKDKFVTNHRIGSHDKFVMPAGQAQGGSHGLSGVRWAGRSWNAGQGYIASDGPDGWQGGGWERLSVGWGDFYPMKVMLCISALKQLWLFQRVETVKRAIMQQYTYFEEF